VELYVLSRDLKLKGIIDTFTSLRWIRRYHKSGEFELHCALNSDTLNLLQRENIICKKGDDEAGYIETRRLRIDSTGQELLEIKGKFLTSYLRRRINWGQLIFNGKTEELMRKLVNDNCISPTNRVLPNLILGSLKNFDDTIQYQDSYGNILSCLESISNTSNLGFKNTLDMENQKIIFNVYKGVDRTVDNGVIAPCVFSRDFENLLEQEYFDGLNNYKNTALIAGTGEGADRKLTAIEQGQGLNRYELYVDARDLQSTKQVEKTDEDGNKTTEDVPMSDNEYMPLLLQRGNEKLAECYEVQTFDSKINTQGNNTYKKDFDVGDIVTVVDKQWGIKINARITEIEEIYEAKGLGVNVIFGNNIPTLIDKIKAVK